MYPMYSSTLTGAGDKIMKCSILQRNRGNTHKITCWIDIHCIYLYILYLIAHHDSRKCATDHIMLVHCMLHNIRWWYWVWAAVSCTLGNRTTETSVKVVTHRKTLLFRYQILVLGYSFSSVLHILTNFCVVAAVCNISHIDENISWGNECSNNL